MTLRCHLLVHLVHVNSLLEVKLPYDPSCPSVCWLVGLSVCLSVCMSLFQVNSHAPIGLSTKNLPCLPCSQSYLNFQLETSYVSLFRWTSTRNLYFV